MLLHSLLERYFAEIEEAVSQLSAYTESYVEEILTSERANLRICMRFQSGGLLEINEAIIVEDGALKTLGYRYHFQSAGIHWCSIMTIRHTSLTCRVFSITSTYPIPSLP